ncbi:MAG TPA: hypothetical protein VLZ74_02170 [Methylocella sp.]|nr:hypothetical protein [Methylocella sp.]
MVRGILIDLDGVVYVGNRALPGSLDAIRQIRESPLPFKFITNTTRRPRRRIVSDLAQLGLDITAQDLFTPAALARDFLAHQNLVPFLIVHPDLREDFDGLQGGGGEAVVVGDAGAFFTYDLLNKAYRKIRHGAEFLALAKNRNFLDHDGELSLDWVLSLLGSNMLPAKRQPCSASRRRPSLSLPWKAWGAVPRTS